MATQWLSKDTVLVDMVGGPIRVKVSDESGGGCSWVASDLDGTEVASGISPVKQNTISDALEAVLKLRV